MEALTIAEKGDGWEALATVHRQMKEKATSSHKRSTQSWRGNARRRSTRARTRTCLGQKQRRTRGRARPRRRSSSPEGAT